MILIAELGTNTGGSLERAFAMVDAAAEAGCDGVKVQAYETADFLSEGHPDWDMFEANRLSWEQIEFVQKQAIRNGLLFGATPTSLDGVRRLAALEVDFLKNGSDYLLRTDMIQAMLATGIKTFVSIGMATQDEITAIPNGAYPMVCTSLYPCPDEHAQLWRVGNRLGRPLRKIGALAYSDHTTGTTAAVIAVARACAWFEFHFTLDHDLPGPDHKFSRTPDEAAELVREVRRADAMLGGTTVLSDQELENRARWRVSVEQPLRG